MTEYFYVWLRKDLSPEQSIIQASHVCFEHGLTLNRETHTPASMVLFEIENQNDLINVHYNLMQQNLFGKIRMFYEPDPAFGTESPPLGYTAVIAGPFDGKNELFKDHKLYRIKKKKPWWRRIYENIQFIHT